MPLGDFLGENPIRDPRLYFKRAYHARRGDKWRWEFDVKEEYPHFVTIHRDIITDNYDNDDHTFFVELRRWVERVAEGDVIFEYRNMGHKFCFNPDKQYSWDKHYSEIKHGYWYFYFESGVDLSMFTLMHGEKLSKVQKYHPDYAERILKDEKQHDPHHY